VRTLELVDSLDRGVPTESAAPENVLELIRGADLICYPIGSFFSSVLCNLLPRGVGQAIASARCPKIYFPNTAEDPEQRGIDVERATELLLETLGHDAPDAAASDLLNFVLLDPRSGAYSLPSAIDRLRPLGVEPIEVDFVSRSQPPEIDPERLANILLSLCAPAAERSASR
jgi:hypothetical protein